ncbi:MAG: hypothetical protein IJC69_04605 [Clostridia bacterium]|nr:hypothetical protein [Clostridia bacterium]
MKLRFKPLIAALIGVSMAIPMLAGCANNGKNDMGALKTIRIGTHAQNEDDPYMIDAITGEQNPGMNADKKKASITALEKVKEELGVEIKFVQYSSDLKQLLLQTVLAGDPYCELAVLWGGVQGTILSQNVLQPLDEYAHIFHDDPDGAWILPQKTFGAYYLMNRDLLFSNTWPICYNITMVEAVPSLKDANGRTIYPSDLYYSGEWTWSRFKDYMTKIKQYYSGKKSASGADIVAFNTNFTFFGLFALHSVGAGVYDGGAMSFDTDAAISACEFVDDLITSEVVSCSSAQRGVKADSGWLTATEAFLRGETVFTNCARWRMDDASINLASRGESMGVIPFPYPDGTNPHTDENSKYRHVTPMADSVGLMRGIDKETSILALEAYKKYKVEFYKAYAQVDSIAKYMEDRASADALTFGVDIFHPEVGEHNLAIWQEFGASPANEYSEACDVMWGWSDILGRSVYGVNGYAKYRTAVQANKQEIYKKLETIGEALNSDGAVDAVAPSLSGKKTIALAEGTDPNSVNWGDYIGASDNADGEYEIDRVKLDFSEVDFNTVGTYTDMLKASVEDNGGNTGSRNFTVLIYRKDNTLPPSLVAKEGIPEIDRNKDVSEIKWGDYVEAAQDADGINISGNISADTGWLDVTEAGEYPVVLVATDYVGNETEVVITVKVK